MKKFSNINENNGEETELGGKSSFDVFLDIIDEQGLLFIKHDFYNIGEYSYFFSSEKIESNMNILNVLERKRSLRNAYLSLAAIKEQRLSFYFGVKRKKLFYGFYDEDTRYVYKVGFFEVTTSYLMKLVNPCFKTIRTILADADMKKMNKLHQIKIELNSFLIEDNQNIKIKDDFRICKQITCESFRTEDLNEERMNYTLLTWTRKFKWYKDVYSFVNITEKQVYFYIKIKENK